MTAWRGSSPSSEGVCSRRGEDMAMADMGKQGNMWRITEYTLVAIHLFLWLWSTGGMLEWLLPEVPWPPYSNPDFSRGILFFHWATVIFASSGFLYGYFSRWRFTPRFMFIGYGLMASMCVIETFGYMTSETKYVAMGLEFAAYAVILIILHASARWARDGGLGRLSRCSAE
jgi:hypothetical protein